jgi:transcriptional regulator with XRE-family HTH domain
MSSAQKNALCNTVGMSNKTNPSRERAKSEFGERLSFALSQSPLGANGESPVNALTREMIRRGHDVTAMAVRKWLSGESIPSIERLADVALLANCSIDYLVHGKGPMRMTQESYNLLAMFDNMTADQRKALLDLGNAFGQQKPDRNAC